MLYAAERCLNLERFISALKQEGEEFWDTHESHTGGVGQGGCGELRGRVCGLGTVLRAREGDLEGHMMSAD